MARKVIAALLFCFFFAGRLWAGNPANDQLIFAGASAPGQNVLSFSNNIYSFTFAGDETLSYQIDLSDPKVVGGMLRVHELTSDSYPIDEGGIVFRDATGAFWYPNTNYKKTTLTSHGKSGNVLTLDFMLNFNGAHPFRYEFRAAGKQLRIRATDLSASTNLANNFSGLAYGKSTGVETPIPIKMQGALALPITMFRHAAPGGVEHYFIANMFDMFQSNGSDYRIGPLISPKIGPDYTTFSLDTASKYDELSNGKIAAPLDDTFLLVVSSKIRDVLLDSTAPASPYRGLLSNRMFFDGTAKEWNNYDKMFDAFGSYGMYNLAGYYFFQWTTSVVDPPSDDSVGPDWSPAYNPTGFKSMLQHGKDYGYLLGAYSAFNCLPETAPAAVQDASHIVRDKDGKAKTYNGLGYPLLSVEAAGMHAQSETAKLKALGADAVYLDIQTYGSIPKGPDGGHLDQTASSPWSKTMRQGYVAQKGWFGDMRETLTGPLIGEGSISVVNANMEWLYYGYVDSVQRCVNTGAGADGKDIPAGSPDAPTNWPIIPEYEWHVAVKNQINHGNGFYHRFFGPSDGPTVVQGDGQPILPLTQDAMDLYQAFLISYGHAGFMITNGTDTVWDVIHYRDAAQTYFMSNALQSLYFASPISSIRYRYAGAWKSFENVIFDTESLDTFRHIPVRLDFQNGLRIYVNHGATPMNVTEGGVTYTLPAETGWYAGMGNGWFVSFSAIAPGTSGKRIDYCKATGQYEYFNGRGQVAGYGGISTSAKRSKWTVAPTNVTVTEDAAGKLTPSLGVPPLLTDIQIFPDNLVVPKGSRVGLRALAFFSNGSFLDVTTKLHWISAKPGVATIHDGAVLTAVNSGTVKIGAIGDASSWIATPITITVP